MDGWMSALTYFNLLNIHIMYVLWTYFKANSYLSLPNQVVSVPKPKQLAQR